MHSPYGVRTPSRKMKLLVYKLLVLFFIFQNNALLSALDLASDEKLKEIKINDLNFNKTQGARYNKNFYPFRSGYQFGGTSNLKPKDTFKIGASSSDNLFSNKRYNSFDLNNNNKLLQPKWWSNSFQKFDLNNNFQPKLSPNSLQTFNTPSIYKNVYQDLSKVSTSGGGRFKGKSLKLLLGIPAGLASIFGVCFKCCRKNNKSPENAEGLQEVAAHT